MRSTHPTFASTARRMAVSFLLASVALAAGCRSWPFGRHAAASPAAAMGTSLEDIDARNRSDISTRLGRPVAPGPATPAEVAAMTHAGVEPRFIVGYVNQSVGMQPISA